MNRDPIDTAALALLRPLLRDLETGRVLVTRLRSGDASDCSLSLRWQPAAAPPTEPHEDATAEDIESAILTYTESQAPVGPACPECRSALLRLDGPPFCPACAWEQPQGPAAG